MSDHSVTLIPPPPGPPTPPTLEHPDTPPAAPFRHRPPSFQAETNQGTGNDHPHRGQHVNISA